MWKCKKCGGEIDFSLYPLYEREEGYEIEITKDKNLLLIKPDCDVRDVFCKNCYNGTSSLGKLKEIAEWEEE